MGAERRAAGELRALGGRRVAGTLLRYGDLARLPDGRSERFEAGALDPLPRSLPLTLQHDRGSPVGMVSLTDSPTELRAAGEVRASVHSLIQRGALGGLSIEFHPVEERTVPDFGASIREIRRARLSGLSVVDAPAYPAAGVEARQRHHRFTGEVPVGANVDCKCADGEAKKVQFGRDAFRGVEDLDVTAISRGAESVVANTATGSLRLRRGAPTAPWPSPSIRSTLRPDGAPASWRQAGVNVYARPVWDYSRHSAFEVDRRCGPSSSRARFFAYLILEAVTVPAGRFARARSGAGRG